MTTKSKKTETVDTDELSNLIRPAYTEDQLKDFPEGERANYIGFKLFPIDILVPADWNYKDDDEFTSEKLRNNIKRIGQVENIQVRLLKTGYYEVVNGNHRLTEMISLGRKFVMCYDHGKITDSEAKRIAIETNETRFESIKDKLNQIVIDIAEEYNYVDLMSTLPMTESQLEDILSPSEDEQVAEYKDEKQFWLNIKCNDEKHSSELYEKLTKEGLYVKIIS